MAIYWQYQWLAGVIITLLVAGTNVAQTAFTNESDLTLPKHPSDAVILALPDNFSPDNANDLLRVYVGDIENCCEGKNAIVGKYQIEASHIRFLPRFEFAERQNYVVQYKDASKSDRYQLTAFTLTFDQTPATAEVVTIYPSGEALPENTLRFYIEFSVPMKPHVAADYIKLRDADGNADNAAFMKFKQELWSADRKRLTLLMDPGRIKRNVSTNLRLGPALVEGKHYALAVDAGWPAADGTQVLGSFSKSFTVSKALRQLPDVDNWQITTPTVGTKEALTLTFDRPLDFHALHKSIRVTSIANEQIKGEIRVSNHETAWSFHPDKYWRDSNIHVIVNTDLEDVAGNNFTEILDHRVNTTIKTSVPKMNHVTLKLSLSQ